MDERTEMLIRELADKLGTTGEHLWGVLLRQASIYGTYWLIISMLFILGPLWFFRELKRNRTSEEPDEMWGFDVEFVGVVGSIVSFILLLTVVLGVEESVITPLFNPEYWALKQLLP